MRTWEPITIGKMNLKHRLAMAPMTRSRAETDGSPNQLMATYCAQRASLGLLITEGTQPSADGQGYPSSPGIYTDEHVAGWRHVTDAVHAGGGHVFIQLMHVGRVGHPSNHPTGGLPMAPSAIAAGHDIFTSQGMQPAPVPRELSTDEIKAIEEEFVHAAERAIEAGADGVELHAANGYLFWQFLHESSNQRTDEYGGEAANRIRFTVETARAVVERIGAHRVGIRLSPNVSFNGLDEGDDYKETYRLLLRELDTLGLAYIHFFWFADEEFLREVRETVKTPILLVRAGRSLDSIEPDLVNGIADVFPVGSATISNPDLVERLSSGTALAPPASPEKFYGGDASGYTDYPRSDANQAESVGAGARP